jgi:NodT family efflux transporter outer membrane factor (OMF) lipoprotein
MRLRLPLALLVRLRLPLALLVFLTGCSSVGPEYERPEVSLNPEWLDAELEQFATSPAELLRWWETLNDPVLSDLINTAVVQNNGIKIAGLRVLEAQAQLGIATGSRFPQVQVISGDASYTDNGDLTQEQFNLGAGLSWEIDFWGRFSNGVEAADANFLATVASYDDVMVLVTATVADIYVVIRATEEQLRLANDSLKLQQRSYDIVEVLFRNGASSELDALQARTLLLSTEATIPELEATLRQAKNSLSVLLGIAPSKFEEIFDGKGVQPDVPASIAVGLPADLLRQRPDVRQAELRAISQNAVVGIATADLYPSFSLTGFLGASSTTVDSGNAIIDNFLSTDGSAFSIGANFVWPFLNYGRIRNNIEVQDARLQQALIAYQEAVIQGAREVQDAMASLASTQAKDLILAEGVEIAERSADLAFLRYQEGFADYQRVLDAQQALFGQQQRFAANRGEVVRSVIKLYRSLGGGWQQ